MKAIILTVGDEILIGQIVNTNASWIGEQLGFAGVDVMQHVSVGDEKEAIIDELEQAFARASLVIVTGGLGPTHDDITKVAVAEYFNVGLHLDENVLEAIRRRFSLKGRTMPESNQVQAMIPDRFEVLPNPVGTAPGLWYSDEWRDRQRMLAVLPGVPHEMRHFMLAEVLPRLRDQSDLHVISHRNLLTTGIGESALQECIGDISPFLDGNMRMAYLPNATGVRLRLTARGDEPVEVQRALDEFEAYLRARIERFVYGMNEDTLEGAVGEMLRDRGLTLSVAESCTGGFVLNRLTNPAGASHYVIGGVVAYCNAVKKELLGVSSSLIKEHGLTSEPVAVAMATGARVEADAVFGLGITGLAGPGGGDDRTPVGTCCIGLSWKAGSLARTFNFPGDREMIRDRAAKMALALLRYHLLGKPAPF